MKEESLESTGTQAVNYTRTATLLDLPRLCARTNRSPDSPNPNSLDTLSIRSWTRIPSVYRESRRVGHRFYDKKTLVVVTANQRKGIQRRGSGEGRAARLTGSCTSPARQGGHTAPDG